MRADRILLVIRKEIVQLLRSKRTIIIALIIPAVLIMMMGFAFTGDIKHTPTVLINEDRRPESLGLVEKLTETDAIDIKYVTETLPPAIDLVKNGKASAVILIPEDFTDRLREGNAYVLLYVDGSDPTLSYTATAAVGQIATQFGSKVAVQTDTQVLYNPKLRYVRFVAPGILGLMLGMTLTAIASTTIVGERERGTFEQLMVSPISGAELLMGKVLFYLFGIGILDIATTLAVVVYALGIPIEGNPVLVVGLLFVYLTASVGLGIFISVTAKSMLQATQTAIYLNNLQVFLSGIIYPIESMPAVIRPVSSFLPLTYIGHGLRLSMVKGASFSAIAMDFAALGVYAVLMYVLAVLAFRKRVD